MATSDNLLITEDRYTIKKVTVAGITGAIGFPVIEALHAAGFEVRALTRSAAAAILLPTKVEVLEVDYTSSKQIEAALLGQDAVISALGDTAGAVAAQEALIHASIAVGVKRFIPSEFGSDTMNARVRSMPFFTDKLRHQELLMEGTRSRPGFSYSIIITGPFLDWGLGVVPFILNVSTQRSDVFDDGSVYFSTTRVSTLGKALVSCLLNSTATANRTLYIHDAVITQNQLIAISESISGKLFDRKAIDTVILEEQAWKDFHDHDAEPFSWIFPFINLSIWSKEELCAFRQTDNKLLGISELQGPELEDVLNAEVIKATKALAAPPTASEDTASAIIDTTLAEKALEEGKKRLDGFVRPRKTSQAEQAEALVKPRSKSQIDPVEVLVRPQKEPQVEEVIG